MKMENKPIKQTDMEKLDVLKAEITERLLAAPAYVQCREVMRSMENAREMMDMIRKDFMFFCLNKVLDGDLIDRYEAIFAEHGIYHNVDAADSVLLLVDGGVWEVRGMAKVYACSGAYVEAYDRTFVKAYGCVVEAYDNSQVEAMMDSLVEAYGDSKVRISGGKVVACDRATVYANDKAEVFAEHKATVWANHGSRVEAMGESVVWAYMAEVDAYGYSCVFGVERTRCNVYDHAIFRQRGTDSIRCSSEEMRLVRGVDEKHVELLMDDREAVDCRRKAKGRE